jgi:hypothetical protein
LSPLGVQDFVGRDRFARFVAVLVVEQLERPRRAPSSVDRMRKNAFVAGALTLAVIPTPFVVNGVV